MSMKMSTKMQLRSNEPLTRSDEDFGQMSLERTVAHAAKSTCPKGGVSCSKDSFAVNQTLVFRIKICGKSPAIWVEANR